MMLADPEPYMSNPYPNRESHHPKPQHLHPAPPPHTHTHTHAHTHTRRGWSHSWLTMKLDDVDDVDEMILWYHVCQTKGTAHGKKPR